MKKIRTKIKICGITSLHDALMAARLGADAIGFIFADSVRRVSPEKVCEIIKRLPPILTTVGVFMNQPLQYVNNTVDETGIDVVQLHGKEPPGYCNSVRRRVIKRIDINEADTRETLVKKMEGYSVSAFLLDPGAGGGRRFKWDKARGIAYPLIIAGGLDPDCVRTVIRLVSPYGLDVCSGVEAFPGRKDYMKVKRFIEEAR